MNSLGYLRGSDYYMGEVMDRLLSYRSLRDADLLRSEVVARSIKAEYTHAVLRGVER